MQALAVNLILVINKQLAEISGNGKSVVENILNLNLTVDLD